METHLYFLRHAESEAKARGIVQGVGLDIPLTDVGFAQAKEAANVLRGFSFDQIFSSTAERAKDTAAAIRVSHESVPYKEIFELHERSKGRGEGLLREEFKKRYPEIEEAWSREEDPRPVDGESFEDVKARAMPIIQKHLAEHAGKNLLYITHGNLIRVVLGEVLNVPYGLRGRITQDYCGLSHIIYNHDRKRFKVDFMNRKLCS